MATDRVIVWRLATALVVLWAPSLVGQVRDTPSAPAAPPVTVTGRVVAGDPSAPVPRARIVIRSTDQPDVFTASDGTFQVTVPPGASSLRISKNGFAPVRVDRRALLPKTDLLVRMAKGGVVFGTVFDALGSPAPNVAVRIRRVEEAGATSGAATQLAAETDDLGEFRVGNLAAGRYTVTAGLAGRGAALDLVGGREGLRALVGEPGDRVELRELLELATARAGAAPQPDAGGARGRGGRGGARGRGADPANAGLHTVDIREGEEASVALTHDSGETTVLDALAAVQSRLPAVAGATVRGRVLGADARPVKGAMVRLSPVSGGTARAAVTDASGLYEMAGVAPGTYRSRVSKTGLAEVEYGQQRLLDSGREIVVSRDQHVRGIDVTMPRPGVIAGTVVDAWGDPVEGLSIEAWQSTYRDGRRSLASPAGLRPRRTDDRGRYRISGLLPGTYYVVATERPSESGRGPEEDAVGARVFYPNAYAPSMATRVEIDTNQDASAIDVTFSPAQSAGVNGIATDATGQPARGRAILAVSQRSGEPMLPLRTTRIADGGLFAFSAVAPGEYVVQVVSNLGPIDGRGGNSARGTQGRGGRGGSGGQAPASASGRGGPTTGGAPGQTTAPAGGAAGQTQRQGPGGATQGARGGGGAPGAGGTGPGAVRGRGANGQRGQAASPAPRAAAPSREFGVAYVTVAEGQNASVRVETSPGMTMSGRVALEGDATSVSPGSFGFTAYPVSADSAPLAGSRAARADVRDDGTFTLTDLHGAVRIEPTRVPDGWWLQSAYVNGTNAVDDAVSLTRGAPALTNVTVTFSSGAGSIEGRVLDDRRQPVNAFSVLVFSSDPNRWFARSPYVRRAGRTQDGTFSVTGLPPAEYLVIAVDRIDDGADDAHWQSPTLLNPLTPAARRVRIAEGQTATAELRLVKR